MAQIIIKTSIDKNNVEAFLDKVYIACKTDPNLSFRPMSEIINAYKKELLLIATENSSAVGWLLRIPFNKNCQELAAGYVLKKYRSLGIFNKLIEKALSYSQSSIIVTFNYRLAEFLMQKKGFKKSSLIEAIRLSKARFLFNRMNFGRVKSIHKHYRKSKPIYVVFTYE
jgi:GNAT superfamily N-acetyltransferase